MTSSNELQGFQYKNHLTGKTWLGEWHPLDSKRAHDHRAPKGAKIRAVCRWRVKLKATRHLRVVASQIPIHPGSSLTTQEQLWIGTRTLLKQAGFDFSKLDIDPFEVTAPTPTWCVAGPHMAYIDFYQVIG